MYEEKNWIVDINRFILNSILYFNKDRENKD